MAKSRRASKAQARLLLNALRSALKVGLCLTAALIGAMYFL
jgi:hypothetical protein